MSDFTDLCESMGLSPGDPESIDIMIHKFGKDFDEEDDDWYFEEDGFTPDEDVGEGPEEDE